MTLRDRLSRAQATEAARLAYARALRADASPAQALPILASSLPPGWRLSERADWAFFIPFTIDHIAGVLRRLSTKEAT